MSWAGTKAGDANHGKLEDEIKRWALWEEGNKGAYDNQKVPFARLLRVFPTAGVSPSPFPPSV